MVSPRYRFTGQVRRFDTYGDRVEWRTPATLIAADRNELAEKVRSSFNASYSNSRKFWSHDFSIERVDELEPAPQPQENQSAWGPIPMYAMLDVWMALGRDPGGFESWALETGYAEAWAYLCAEIRKARKPQEFDS